MTASRAGQVVYAIWYRETVRFFRDRSRWLGMLVQPLLYLLLVGDGIAGSMTFRGTAGAAGVSYITFMYPGIVGMSVLFTAGSSGVGIVWDREFGFLKEVLVAPVPRWGIAVGKALGIGTVVLLQSAVLLVLAPLARVPLQPLSAVELVGVCVLMSFALGGLGILVAARTQTMEGFQIAMNIFTMPMFFLSGALYPLKGLPGWLGLLSQADPLTYGIDALRNVLYAAGQPARTLVRYSVGRDLAVTVALAALLTAAAAWAFEAQE